MSHNLGVPASRVTKPATGTLAASYYVHTRPQPCAGGSTALSCGLPEPKRKGV